MSITYINLKPFNLPIIENTYYLPIKPLNGLIDKSVYLCRGGR
jgi:hypothetical protein